jgi:hypothetical protein
MGPLDKIRKEVHELTGFVHAEEIREVIPTSESTFSPCAGAKKTFCELSNRQMKGS